MVIPSLSICSGIGGLDLGLRIADSRLRTVGFVERDVFAANILVERMAQSYLDDAPIWDCLHSFPVHLFYGRVKLVKGGIPCQPYSSAGLGLGAEDPRDLWPATVQLLVRLGYPALFLENVVGFRSKGMPRVLHTLARLGYNVEWCHFSNKQLGASHSRSRIALLAYTHRSEVWLKQGRGEQGGANPVQFEDAGEGVAHSESSRPARGWGHPGGWVGYPEFSVGGEGLANSTSPGLQGGDWFSSGVSGFAPTGSLMGNPFSEQLHRTRGFETGGESQSTNSGSWLEYSQGSGLEACGRRSTHSGSFNSSLRFWPPPPSCDSWGEWPEQYWPSAPSKYPVRGAVDGVPPWLELSRSNRTDRLHKLGNAFSPPVAAVAWCVLTDRIRERLLAK